MDENASEITYDAQARLEELKGNEADSRQRLLSLRYTQSMLESAEWTCRSITENRKIAEKTDSLKKQLKSSFARAEYSAVKNENIKKGACKAAEKAESAMRLFSDLVAADQIAKSGSEKEKEKIYRKSSGIFSDQHEAWSAYTLDKVNAMILDRDSHILDMLSADVQTLRKIEEEAKGLRKITDDLSKLIQNLETVHGISVKSAADLAERYDDILDSIRKRRAAEEYKHMELASMISGATDSENEDKSQSSASDTQSEERQDAAIE